MPLLALCNFLNQDQFVEETVLFFMQHIEQP